MNLLFILWFIFYFTHSLFANNSVKQKLIRWFPFLSRYYRIGYNLLSVLLFGFAWYQQSKLGHTLLFRFDPIVNYLGLGLILISLMGMWLSFKSYSKREFFGLSQWKEDAKENAVHIELNRNGLNKYVRHPLYSFTFLFLLGYLLYKPYLSSMPFVCFGYIYLVIGTFLEEQKLAQQFGEAYKNYKQQVPRFFPNVLTIFQSRQ